jgi:hypothetical protein
MASRSTTNLKQEILSNNWLGVIVDGKLRSNTLETRNTEEQLDSSDRQWQVAGQHN